MRKKLPAEEKRSNIIGIKVKPETREKLEWIAEREQLKLSTYIDELLTKHIEAYLKKNNIIWNKLTEEEKRVEKKKTTKKRKEDTQ